MAIKLKEELNFKWNSEHFQFWYFNHILNLVAQAALDQVKESVYKVLIINS